MTITQIITAVVPHQSMSVPTIYRHLRRLKIKPLGIRQSPQRYPDDAARRILKALGLPARATRHGRNRRAA